MKYDLNDISDSLSQKKDFARQVLELDTTERASIEYKISELRGKLERLEKKKKELQKASSLDSVLEFLFFKNECERFYDFLSSGIRHPYKALKTVCNTRDNFSPYAYLAGVRTLNNVTVNDQVNVNTHGKGVGNVLITDFTVENDDVVFLWVNPGALRHNRNVETRIPVRWFTDKKALIEEFQNASEAEEELRRETKAKKIAEGKLKRKMRRAGRDDESIQLSSSGTVFDSEKFLSQCSTLDPKKLKEYFYPYAAVKTLCDYAFVTGNLVYSEDIRSLFIEPLVQTNKGIKEFHVHAINEVHVKVFNSLISEHEVLWQETNR